MLCLACPSLQPFTVAEGLRVSMTIYPLVKTYILYMTLHLQEIWNKPKLLCTWQTHYDILKQGWWRQMEELNKKDKIGIQNFWTGPKNKFYYFYMSRSESAWDTAEAPVRISIWRCCQNLHLKLLSKYSSNAAVAISIWRCCQSLHRILLS